MTRALLLALVLFGCARSIEAPQECSAPPELVESLNPIDRALAETFAASCLQLLTEDPRALCRRLHADLLGRYPSSAELARCDDPSFDHLLRQLQADPRYLLHAERFWRDGLQLSDAIDWRYLRSLFELVDQLHRGTLRYEEFVARAMAEPAPALSGFGAEGSFALFLGRRPSAFERRDFDRLFALWRPTSRYPGEDNLDVAEVGASIDPQACLAFGGCRTELFGGGAIEIAARPVNDRGFAVAIPYEELRASEREALETPGRLLGGDAALWEAAADRLLDRFLGWDDGEFLPRTTGALLPRVRQALAEHLQRTGDYPGAERIVLSSWLYRQRAAEPLDRPVFAVGPLKRAPNEVLLDSMLSGSKIDLGVCEPRYPIRRYARELLDRHALGGIDLAALERDFARIHELLSPRTRFAVGERGIAEPDFRYEDLAALIGGCTTRSSEQGVFFALAHERLVEELCRRELAAPTSLEEQMQLHLARDPTPAELEGMTAALGGCDDCSFDACTAVIGSGEMLFY